MRNVVNVYGLHLQFDRDALSPRGHPEKLAENMVNQINEVLGREFPDAQPQLSWNREDIDVQLDEVDD